MTHQAAMAAMAVEFDRNKGGGFGWRLTGEEEDEQLAQLAWHSIESREEARKQGVEHGRKGGGQVPIF